MLNKEGASGDRGGESMRSLPPDGIINPRMKSTGFKIPNTSLFEDRLREVTGSFGINTHTIKH